MILKLSPKYWKFNFYDFITLALFLYHIVNVALGEACNFETIHRW